jgi:Flp pilus assembly pilin Flp
MTKFFNFLRDESGAVTIDWVALTAGILLLGITLVYAIFNNGVGSLAKNINSNLTAAGANVSTGAAPSQGSFK